MAAACVETPGNTLTNLENGIGPCDDFIVWQCLRLCVVALGDAESFVYLAAIQTLAVISDLTLDVAQAIGIAVAVGVFHCRGFDTIELTNEQRVKLTEALIQTVRRKAVVEGNLASLIDILVFRNISLPDISPLVQTEVSDAAIHSQTHKYFSQRSDAIDSLTTKEELWEDMDIRLKTGGPLFVAEEADLVRSGKLVLVSELISKMHPASVARYCGILTWCATNTLILSEKRIIRRSGALLARELYATLLREHFAVDGYGFAMQFVMGSEHELAVMLERCAAGEDLQDWVQNQERFFDPATVARCKEALELLCQARDAGILAAARVAANAMKRNAAVPILLEPSRIHEIDVQRSMNASKLIEEVE
jgi:hypothetical protein